MHAGSELFQPLRRPGDAEILDGWMGKAPLPAYYLRLPAPVAGVVFGSSAARIVQALYLSCFGAAYFVLQNHFQNYFAEFFREEGSIP